MSTRPGPDCHPGWRRPSDRLGHTRATNPGHSRITTVTNLAWHRFPARLAQPARTSFRHHRSSKLVMRVRFPSPAPTEFSQFRGVVGAAGVQDQDATERRRARCVPDGGLSAAACGRVACDRLRRTSARHPLARIRRLRRRRTEIVIRQEQEPLLCLALRAGGYPQSLVQGLLGAIFAGSPAVTTATIWLRESLCATRTRARSPTRTGSLT
jgi:hypothetical protein